MSADDQRAQQVFEEALDHPLEKRVAFLDAACADDPELRREVESLQDEIRRLQGELANLASCVLQATDPLPTVS